VSSRSSMLLALMLGAISAPIVAADEAAPAAIVPLDFVQAATDDKAGDYARAHEEYLTLAVIGQGAADYNLAVMALNGRLGSTDPGEVLGWFSAAEELGIKGPDLATLRSEASPAAQRRAAEILAKYGKAAVTSRLEDSIRECAFTSRPVQVNAATDRLLITWPKITKSAWDSANYPLGARHEGDQGLVRVTMIIGVDGHAHDPRIEAAVSGEPRDGFEDEVIRIALMSSYTSGTRNGHPVATRVNQSVRFIISLAAEFWDKSVLLQLRSKAFEGDPGAQYTVASIAMLDSNARSLMSLSTDDEIHLAVSAALGGSREMKYWMAQELGGADCHEAVAARSWLLQAAAAGHPEAQLDLAERGITEAGRVDPRAVVWLRKAAESQDQYVMKHVAWIMATSSVPSVRDPATALHLAKQLPARSSPNPEFATVLAAALAANGDFRGARAAMEEGVAKARRLGWDEAALRGQLQSYAESHAVLNTPLVAAAEQSSLLRDGPMH
jgi:TPR repeat protein